MVPPEGIEPSYTGFVDQRVIHYATETGARPKSQRLSEGLVASFTCWRMSWKSSTKRLLPPFLSYHRR